MKNIKETKKEKQLIGTKYAYIPFSTFQTETDFIISFLKNRSKK